MKKITITLTEKQLEDIDLAFLLATKICLDKDDEDKAFDMEGLRGLFSDAADAAVEE